MKNSTILRVVILGAIAIVGIIAMQSYWVISTWNINEEEFHKKVNLALIRTAQSLAAFNGTELPSRNIVRQRTSNYYVVNTEYEINTTLLQYYLQQEFRELALNIDFEYAVFDCTTDEMVYGGYVSYSNKKIDDLVLGDLPKSESEDLNYYFGVKFPSLSGFLLGKIQLAIVLSGILLITVVFFAYSMFVILRQKRLSEMQKDFINNMTHEFKTPISTIRVSADVFLNHPLIRSDARLRQYAGIISEQNLRLNRQVEKVLQLARIEKGKLELKREWLNLREIIEDAVNSASVQVEKLGGELTCRLDRRPLCIYADRFHLTNILYNLLDNATKYHRGRPRIVVTSSQEPGRIVLKIADRGIGISREQLSRVFEKFYRIPTGDIHNIKGFGLGLYYVKSICEAHGWEVNLDSEPGRGTTVSVAFPAGAAKQNTNP